MGSDHYCLRWNNHQSNLLGVFSQLLEAESLVDVTLASSEGHSLRAHKVVLSACSTYFRALFLDHPARHPIVILKDVCFAELRTLVEFMYRGEVSVETCRLSALLKTAESLKVKGLAEMTALKSRMESDSNGGGNNGNGNSGDGGGGGTGDSGGGGEEAGSPAGAGPRSSPQHQAGPACTFTPPPAHTSSSPPSSHPDRVCPPVSPPDTRDSDSIQSGPSDMTLPTTAPLSPQSSANEPVPGPSGLPPVQDVPLSLKKEVDWDRSDDNKSLTGESSSDYRHPHDPESCEMNEGRSMYSCMYCGAVFPHQSKLTRHILSHSLETLKHREQMLAAAAAAAAASVVTGPPPAPPQHHPHHQPPSLPPHYHHLYAPIMASSIIKQETSQSPLPQQGALCKFCGKTFPDVSTLIGHLPAHTGDRPFKCEFCGKAFKLRHHMKDHCRVHTGERPFRCSLCGKTFSRSTILKAHEKTHYPKYMRKFLSSPSPEDERRTHELPHLMPCDLSVESLCLPRPMPCDLPPESIYLPRTSSPSP